MLTATSRNLDPTRPINDNCGWEHVLTDLTTFHDYADANVLATRTASLSSTITTGRALAHRGVTTARFRGMVVAEGRLLQQWREELRFGVDGAQLQLEGRDDFVASTVRVTGLADGAYTRFRKDIDFAIDAQGVIGFLASAPGVPRDGAALLQGIVWCGQCGHKMAVQYRGSNRYICHYLHRSQGDPICQHLPADPIDARVVEAFFAAVTPAELEAWARAQEARHRSDEALDRAEAQQVERLRYQALLAERQFTKVDPGPWQRAAVQPQCCRRTGASLGTGAARTAPGRGGALTASGGTRHAGDAVDQGSGRLRRAWPAAPGPLATA